MIWNALSTSPIEIARSVFRCGLHTTARILRPLLARMPRRADLAQDVRTAFAAAMNAKATSRPLWTDATACAWCSTFNPRDPRNAHVSHGICPSCVAKFEGGRA